MKQTTMDEIVGAWIDATGTVVASLGISPFFTDIDFDGTFLGSNFLTEEEAQNLVTDLGQWGNILQASGNGIEALGNDSLLGTIGNEIGASGNLAVLYSLQSELEKDEVYQLIIVGNLLQGYGAYLAGISELKESNNPTELLSAYGNFTQTFGNSLQAYGGYELLQGFKIRGNIYIFIGSWIQTFGAIVAAIGTTLESE
ncbi:DUF6944 family repetitive protein [Turicibacter sanguinis]|uniref:DUF6944 family repetitive protein n=1 Tax=Turicibacter sanguinis TaxID=154288 RepID=UPI0018A8DCF7|nr:hypothetical protein [Turicibacter sanguinis]MCU7196963.1 hypothetical protein [Turicibacter sanguinis]